MKLELSSVSDDTETRDGHLIRVETLNAVDGRSDTDAIITYRLTDSHSRLEQLDPQLLLRCLYSVDWVFAAQFLMLGQKKCLSCRLQFVASMKLEKSGRGTLEVWFLRQRHSFFLKSRPVSCSDAAYTADFHRQSLLSPGRAAKPPA
jgi:hypothetical protein